MKCNTCFGTNSVSLFFFKILYCILYSSYDIFITQCFRSNSEDKALCEKIGFEFWIFKFLISLGNKLQLKLKNLQKKDVSHLKLKKSTAPLNFATFKFGAKFQLKLTNLMFWAKFSRKECFQSKTQKLKTTIEFSIFELALVLNSS